LSQRDFSRYIKKEIRLCGSREGDGQVSVFFWGKNSFGGLAPPPTCFAMSVIRQFSLACTNPINEVWCDSDESYLLPFMPAKVDASGLVRKCVPNFLTGQA
jgi:hypothetical protein